MNEEMKKTKTNSKYLCAINIVVVVVMMSALELYKINSELYFLALVVNKSSIII
jgi:hypothetical protein